MNKKNYNERQEDRAEASFPYILGLMCALVIGILVEWLLEHI